MRGAVDGELGRIRQCGDQFLREAGLLGDTFSLSMPRAQMLRYGENPHQTGALYGDFPRIAEQLHGKELSFNNVFDISSAINLMIEFGDYQGAVVAILKHNTPCGVGVGPTLKSAWDKAFATDPDSPFGGIIISNRPWDIEFARAVDELFTEVLIAPEYPPVYNNLGTALRAKGQLTDAVSTYQQALRLKPDFLDAHNNLGIALMELGQHDEAAGEAALMRASLVQHGDRERCDHDAEAEAAGEQLQRRGEIGGPQLVEAPAGHQGEGGGR